MSSSCLSGLLLFEVFVCVIQVIVCLFLLCTIFFICTYVGGKKINNKRYYLERNKILFLYKPNCLAFHNFYHVKKSRIQLLTQLYEKPFDVWAHQTSIEGHWTQLFGSVIGLLCMAVSSSCSSVRVRYTCSPKNLYV